MGVLSPQFGSLIPTAAPVTLSSNYLNFNSGGGNDFAQQYLPEIYEAEVERYGNRTVGGFLRMVGAEMPMMSDQVVWSEQNRLHISYDNVVSNAVGVNAGNRLTIQGINTSTLRNVIAVNDTIVIMDPSDPAFTCKAIVTASVAATGVVDVVAYNRAAVNAGVARNGCKIFVYGSEFAKGVSGTGAGIDAIPAIEPQLTTFSNKPIIIRNRYAVSGSDTAQIGWVEVAGEDGTSGYLWYLKAEGETRMRFEDYLEMAMIEGELATSGQVTAIRGALTQFANQGGNGATAGSIGTEGLFAAINNGGNVLSGYSGSLQDFDSVLQLLDSQGAIEENMLFLDRKTELLFDNMLAQQNSYGAGGTSYGVFENSEDMALNLGFSGFRRGSYDFYKTSWKYLNDASLRGGSTNFVNGDNIDGVLVPAGTSTVYDQLLGTNIRRPFLHVRYRASQADDRRMKSWLTGSVGGAHTSALDAMEVNFLSERCLCTQARNNFVLFTA